MKKSLVITGISTGFFLLAHAQMYGANYSPVSCDSQSFFAENTCDLCYEEKNPAFPLQKLTGMYDTWQGHDENPPIVYEDEQTLHPIMINLGGTSTKWVYSAADTSTMWELTSEIPWTTTGATNRKVVTIKKDESLKFVQQKPDSYIMLETTDKKAGEIIGMMKFPLIYRYIDPNTGTESDPIAHYECVVHRAGEDTKTGITIVPPANSVTEPVKVVVQVPTPEPVKVVVQATTTPTPKQITETKTGPELWIVGIIAMFTTAVLLLSKRRKV